MLSIRQMSSIQCKLAPPYQLFFQESDNTNSTLICPIKKLYNLFLLFEKMSFSSRNTTVLIVATKCNNLTFCLYQKGQPEGIRSSHTYTLTDVRRNATGDYRCSLTDKKSMIASTAITVHCKSPYSSYNVVSCDLLKVIETSSILLSICTAILKPCRDRIAATLTMINLHLFYKCLQFEVSTKHIHGY